MDLFQHQSWILHVILQEKQQLKVNRHWPYNVKKKKKANTNGTQLLYFLFIKAHLFADYNQIGSAYAPKCSLFSQGGDAIRDQFRQNDR